MLCFVHFSISSILSLLCVLAASSAWKEDEEHVFDKRSDANGIGSSDNNIAEVRINSKHTFWLSVVPGTVDSRAIPRQYTPITSAEAIRGPPCTGFFFYTSSKLEHPFVTSSFGFAYDEQDYMRSRGRHWDTIKQAQQIPRELQLSARIGSSFAADRIFFYQQRHPRYDVIVLLEMMNGNVLPVTVPMELFSSGGNPAGASDIGQPFELNKFFEVKRATAVAALFLDRIECSIIGTHIEFFSAENPLIKPVSKAWRLACWERQP